MKHRRIVGLASAICLALSLGLPASAASDQLSADVRVSKFAGDTVVCQIVEVSDSGNSSTKMIEVDIPAAATQAEENALVQAAIMGTAQRGASPYAVNAIFDTISTKTDLSIGSTTQRNVGGGKLTKAYATLVAQFNGISGAGTPTMYVTFDNGSDEFTYEVEVNKGTNVLGVVKSADDGFAMGIDKTVNVTAILASGTISVDECNFMGSQYDY